MATPSFPLQLLLLLLSVTTLCTVEAVRTTTTTTTTTANNDDEKRAALQDLITSIRPSCSSSLAEGARERALQWMVEQDQFVSDETWSNLFNRRRQQRALAEDDENDEVALGIALALQRYALVEFFHSVNGNTETGLYDGEYAYGYVSPDSDAAAGRGFGDEYSPWLNALSNVCTWGNSLDLECNDQGLVTGFRLASVGLVGPIPMDSLWLLKEHLLSIDLANNDLTGPIPTEFGSFATLERLFLGRNALTGPIPTELGQLSTNLIGLYLHENQLTGPIPTELGNLSPTTLRWMYLHTNQLSGIVPSSDLYKLQSLGMLNMYNNDQLTGTIDNEEFACRVKPMVDCDRVTCGPTFSGCCIGRYPIDSIHDGAFYTCPA